MKNNKRQNSVKNLVSLYTVVIGVALAYAVRGVVNSSIIENAINWSSVLLFLGFISTLFPFFHGALRHLDDAYIENNNRHISHAALIIDFILLFLHALSFVVLSLLITHPTHFILVLIGILSIDVLWGGFATFASSTKATGQRLRAEAKWAIINLAFVLASLWYLWTHSFFVNELAVPMNLAVPIAIFCVLRTLFDYVWCREFYFPT